MLNTGWRILMPRIAEAPRYLAKTVLASGRVPRSGYCASTEIEKHQQLEFISFPCRLRSNSCIRFVQHFPEIERIRIKRPGDRLRREDTPTDCRLVITM